MTKRTKKKAAPVATDPNQRVIRIKQGLLNSRLMGAHHDGYQSGFIDGKHEAYKSVQKYLVEMSDKFPGNAGITCTLGEVTRIIANL